MSSSARFGLPCDPGRLLVGAALTAAHLCLSSAFAAISLETTPSYESTPSGHIATGGAFADIDQDGWLDMVVANGNDIDRQRVSIYHNRGDGTFPLAPTWQSGDIDYHGHLDVGDVNGDRLPDLVVSVYIGPAGFVQPGEVKLYLGDGTGFTSNPVWTSPSFYTFSCALGDADGDGDLDLACSAGESYNGFADSQKIFFNDGGTFAPAPGWESDEIGYSLDVEWDDYDLDGDLDVGFCGISGPNRIYRNDQTSGGGIATTATWESGDMPSFGNSASFGDLDGDGYPELAVADNFQLGGAGKFKVYANHAGEFATVPAWTSASGGYGSHVSWVDLDHDADLDLAVSGWWELSRFYENLGGSLTPAPVWSSTRSSVVENMFWGDVDNDALFDNGGAYAIGDGARTFFSVGDASVHSIDAVRIGGVLTDPGDYCFSLTHGWISLATPPAAGEGVSIEFTYSTDLDLGVTTWDSGVGNFVYYNRQTASGTAETVLPVSGLSAAPNPVRTLTQLRYRGRSVPEASLDIIDVSGREVRSLHRGSVSEGLRIWEWDRRDDSGRSVASGVYFARLASAQEVGTLRLVVID
jgi:hypothetical protein